MKDKLVAFVLVVGLILIIASGVGLFANMISCRSQTDKTPYDRAFIIQPDNTLVYGNLDYYSTFNNGKMYRLRMGNGKTYLVPFTRLTLIDEYE